MVIKYLLYPKKKKKKKKDYKGVNIYQHDTTELINPDLKLRENLSQSIHNLYIDNYLILHYICIQNKVIALRFLLENGANINIRDAKGYTALHYAVINDSIACINELLSYGALTNVFLYNSALSPLQCTNNQVIKQKLIIKNPAMLYTIKVLHDKIYKPAEKIKIKFQTPFGINNDDIIQMRVITDITKPWINHHIRLGSEWKVKDLIKNHDDNVGYLSINTSLISKGYYRFVYKANKADVYALEQIYIASLNHAKPYIGTKCQVKQFGYGTVVNYREYDDIYTIQLDYKLARNQPIYMYIHGSIFLQQKNNSYGLKKKKSMNNWIKTIKQKTIGIASSNICQIINVEHELYLKKKKNKIKKKKKEEEEEEEKNVKKKIKKMEKKMMMMMMMKFYVLLQLIIYHKVY